MKKGMRQILTGAIFAFLMNGIAFAEVPPDPVWIRQAGPGGIGHSQSVAFDGLGNLYLGGNGSYTGCIAKYSSDGTPVWTRQLSAPSLATYGHGIAADQVGNSYLTGWTWGNLDGPNAGNEDAFLAKYDAAGNLQWTRQFGTYPTDEGKSVTVDQSGNIIMVGDTVGASGADTEGFIRKYDPMGNLLWSRASGISGHDEATGVFVDSAGNSYVAGDVDNRLTVIDGKIVYGSIDTVLAKYDVEGNLLWSQQHRRSAGFAYSRGVAVDSQGNAYIAGDSSGTFMLKFDPNGNLLWDRQMSTTGRGGGVAVDAQGNPYMLGSVDLNGGYDAFLWKCDPNGTLLWTDQLASNGYWNDDIGYGIALNSSGALFVTGDTTGYLGGVGSSGPFLIKYQVPEPISISFFALSILALWRPRKSR